MDNLLDMLTKAGYEVSSIGSDVLPCTLGLGDQPIGFLLEDLSVRLLPDQEKERARIQPVIEFAAENQGIEQDQGEYKLSQYQNVILTASFDYESCRPVYNIYSEDQNKEWTLLNSSEVKSVATKDFVARSGLVSGEIPAPTLETSRVRQFMNAIKDKGYQFRENREEAQRSYDITDRDGKTVGYIGKNNRVTIISEDSRVKRTLTNAYLDTNPNNVLLPPFFERLKERLKDIGLALKVIFTPKGKHYAIHNERQEIATVSEQHEVTYTDAATAAQKTRIDALVEELRQEQLDREQPAATVSQEPEHIGMEQAAISPADIQHIAEAVLSDPAMAEALFQTVLSDPEFVSRLNENLAQTQKAATPTNESPSPELNQEAATEKQPMQESPAAQKIKQSFEKEYGYLQTLFGFNQEKYDALKADMTARFGTADPKEFSEMLAQGKFDKADSLQGKLEISQQIAEMKNNARTQREKTQEKERA
ncbi:hypothetical protein A7X67_11020 [Clostridium sp. W14A]|nr:hypothetical protein A7X67_11020 [Clostridium sp. W14A]